MLSVGSKNFLVKATQRAPAEQLYQELNGLFAIYKPPETLEIDVLKKLKFTLLRGILK